MTIGIIVNAGDEKRNISDILIFDAILNYSENYQSKLTTNPIDGAGVLNDHVVNDSPTFSIKGVFSNADFNINQRMDSRFKALNRTEPTELVEVRKVKDTLLESVANAILPFGKTVEPSIEMSERSFDAVALVKDKLISVRKAKTLVAIQQLNQDGSAGDSIENLVITNIQFTEDATTGDALSVDLTLQQAEFVELKTQSVTRRSSIGKTSGDIKDKAQEAVSKGAVTAKKTIYQFGVDGASEKINDAIDYFRDGMKDGPVKKYLNIFGESN